VFWFNFNTAWFPARSLVAVCVSYYSPCTENTQNSINPAFFLHGGVHCAPLNRFRSLFVWFFFAKVKHLNNYHIPKNTKPFLIFIENSLKKMSVRLKTEPSSKLKYLHYTLIVCPRILYIPTSFCAVIIFYVVTYRRGILCYEYFQIDK